MGGLLDALRSYGIPDDMAVFISDAYYGGGKEAVDIYLDNSGFGDDKDFCTSVRDIIQEYEE